MTRILVTGGTGVLGHQVVAKLVNMGYTVRTSSRRPAPAEMRGGIEWAQMDLETGNGMAEALAGVQTIVHAASSPFKRVARVDVEGTRRLLEQAQAAGVSHLIYISIAGIERFPTYSYYRAKLATEEIITHGSMPWTILRATQFHDLIDLGLRFLSRFPVMPVPGDLQAQPVDSGEVAAVLAAGVAHGPAGRPPDMGGPQVLNAKEATLSWLAARGQRRLIVPLHLPGATAEGFRKGYNTCPDHRQGKITWDEWVRNKYATRSVRTRSPYEGRSSS